MENERGTDFKVGDIVRYLGGDNHFVGKHGLVVGVRQVSDLYQVRFEGHPYRVWRDPKELKLIDEKPVTPERYPVGTRVMFKPEGYPQSGYVGTITHDDGAPLDCFPYRVQFNHRRKYKWVNHEEVEPCGPIPSPSSKPQPSTPKLTVLLEPNILQSILERYVQEDLGIHGYAVTPPVSSALEVTLSRV